MSRASVISLDEVKVAREDEIFRRDTLSAIKTANTVYAEAMNDMSEVYLLWEDSEMYKHTCSEDALESYEKSLKLLASLVRSCGDDLRRNIKKMEFLQTACLNPLTGSMQWKIETEMYELMEEIKEYEKEYKEISGLWRESK